jgi:hypothetical protein
MMAYGPPFPESGLGSLTDDVSAWWASTGAPFFQKAASYIPTMTDFWNWWAQVKAQWNDIFGFPDQAHALMDHAAGLQVRAANVVATDPTLLDPQDQAGLQAEQDAVSSLWQDWWNTLKPKLDAWTPSWLAADPSSGISGYPSRAGLGIIPVVAVAGILALAFVLAWIQQKKADLALHAQNIAALESKVVTAEQLAGITTAESSSTSLNPLSSITSTLGSAGTIAIYGLLAYGGYLLLSKR